MKTVIVAGTCDTKAPQLEFVKRQIESLGVPAKLVDLSTQAHGSSRDVSAQEVASHHPSGASAVFTGDRGSSVAAMAVAFEHYLLAQSDVGGVIGLGGSGGTALVTPAMRALPIGTPKLMVSTVASGNVAPYVGPTDIAMMYSVTDISGLNRVSRVVLANAANAVAGMVEHASSATHDDKPALGLTMFGVTTPCVQAITKMLETDYDCMVFHATGTGGTSMEKLVDSQLIGGVLDITTTEVCDLLFGGVFACSEDRFGAIARTKVPYVGSCGALDMVNFGARDTVPAALEGRHFYVHNPQVTLMRTTPAENAQMGKWIANKLNRCAGPVRFLIPEGGVSLLDASGMPFHDPEADRALFGALESLFQVSANHQLVRVPHNINAPEFSAAAVEHFRAIT